VPAGEAARAVQSVLEVPDDPIAEREAVTLEERVEEDIEREDLASGDVVSHLPADAAVVGEHPDAFGNDVRLLGQVGIERPPSLVRLAEVVGRRGDDQARGARGKRVQQVEAVASVEHDGRAGGVLAGDPDPRLLRHPHRALRTAPDGPRSRATQLVSALLTTSRSSSCEVGASSSSGTSGFAVRAGDAAVIPRATPHAFVNDGRAATITMAVFSPPLDPPDRAPAFDSPGIDR